MATEQTHLRSEKSGVSSLIRPKFTAGQFLEDEDLTAGIVYAQMLNRVVLRAMLGCGVLCGLRVTADTQCKLTIKVACGVALACDGSVIEMSEEAVLVLDPTCDKPLPPILWIVLCRYEKGCAPRDVRCGDEDDAHASACTRVREGYSVRAYDVPPTGACPAPATDAAKDGGGQDRTDGPPDHHADHVRGVCACGCDCDCVVLAVVRKSGETYEVDHSVRRFVRPALLPDPALKPGRAETSPPADQAAEDRTRSFAIPFEGRKTALNEAAQGDLQLAMKDYHSHAAATVTITGEGVGKDLVLSAQRAQSVEAALLKAGVPADRIRAQARAIADPGGESGDAQTSRVTVAVSPD